MGNRSCGGEHAADSSGKETAKPAVNYPTLSWHSDKYREDPLVQLYFAAGRNHLEGVLDALARGPLDVNKLIRLKLSADGAPPSLAFPALTHAVRHVAASIGNEQQRQELIVHSLLAHHANVNEPGARGFRPLHCARSPQMVELLLAAKADVDAVDDEGRTPLMFAVMHNNKQTALALLHSGASVTVVSRQGWNAANAGGYDTDLHRLVREHIWALDKPSLKLLRFLRYLAVPSAELIVEYTNFQMPIDKATRKMVAETKEYFHKRLPTAAVDARADVAVQQCLAHGADVSKYPSIVFKVLKWPGNVTTVFNCVQSLLEAKAKADIFDEDKQSPLHFARSAPMAQLLFKYKAPLEAKSRVSGTTPLFAATYNAQFEVVHVLLELKADALTENAEQQTIWELKAFCAASATENGAQCQELVIQQAKYRFGLLAKLALAADINGMMNYLEWNTVHEELEYKRTALHYACMHGNTSSIGLLLEHKAKVDAADLFGDTPLMTAMYWDNKQACERLLRAGATKPVSFIKHVNPDLVEFVRTWVAPLERPDEEYFPL